MVLNKEIVLIHGTWCDGNVWGEFATGLRQMGYKVHTPSFRYHDLPYQECLAKVGTVTLQDYRDRKIIPYTQFAGKILYKTSDLEKILEENYKSCRTG